MRITVFLVEVALTVNSVHEVLTDYLSYPVITCVSLSHARKMTFPAVTICNSNPINCYNLAQLQDELQALWDMSGCTIYAVWLLPVRWLLTSEVRREDLKKALDGYTVLIHD